MSQPPAPGTVEFDRQVLRDVLEVQGLHIRGVAAPAVLAELLDRALDLTGSRAGFLAERAVDPSDKTASLRIHALADLSVVTDDGEPGAPEDLDQIADRPLDDLYGQAAETGRPVVANDVAGGAGGSGSPPGGLEVQRYLGLPLIVDDEVVGQLGLCNRPDDYDDTLIASLEPLASSAAELLQAMITHRERSASHEHLSALAQTLRESLLPPGLPSIGWLDIAAAFRPAADGHGVMGDFYDVFQTVPGRWFFIVGDVRGHGPEAAKTTALARWSLRAKATNADDPAALLDALNEQLVARGDPDAPHISAIVVLVDANESETLTPMTLRLATAGHPPPVVRQRDGTVTRLAPMGTILGVFDDAGLQTREVELGPGDSLVLFTDGVTEGRTRDLLYGELDLAEALADESMASASDIVAAALAMSDDADIAHDDDAAVLVLRVPGSG